jgi:hypothetical protein
MLYCERGLDLSTSAIMFHHLSSEAQEMALSFMNAASPYELHWDVMPMAQLPYGIISDFEQYDIDLQALTQIGYYRQMAR